MFLTPYLLAFYRARCIDSDKVPLEGPAIIAPNHFSFMDHFFIAVYMRRKVQFMAKSQLFKRPMQFIYEHGGVFPIRRGHRDEEGLKTARTVLGRGNIIVMYAEGGRSRTEKLGEPKPGIGKLALESGAPVVPSAIVGSAKVRNWKKLQFPKVTVQYGDPIKFDKVVEEPSRDQSQAASEMIFERIEKVYYGLAENGRKRSIEAARSARRATKHAAKSAARRTAAP
jgi:1-acyl-sn-glycerol-3-phosphate acyltransferase